MDGMKVEWVDYKQKEIFKFVWKWNENLANPGYSFSVHVP